MKKCTGLLILFSSAAALAAGGGHSDNHVPLEQIGWQGANLGLLLAAMYIFLKKSMVETFAKRREDFLVQTEKTKASLKEAESALSEIKQRLATLESGEKATLENARRESDLMAAALIKDAEQMADKMKKDAEATIKNETSKARAEINAAILNQAIAGAHKSLSAQAPGVSAEQEKNFVNQLGQVRA